VRSGLCGEWAFADACRFGDGCDRMTETSTFETWATIVGVAVTAIAGDVLTAGAMRRIGDLDDIRAKSGMAGAIKAVVESGMFLAGVCCMALSFFTLLFTLSKVDVSLAAPASASLTFIGNAAAAKIFLHENVDRRRWMAAVFVCVGVVLLSR
jgi:multidrug transporter EmrE-like cation transporter